MLPDLKLQIFEGPMELLVNLVHSQKIDIHEIPIAQITNQYMAYLECLRERDIALCVEFLTMASSLMLVKSRQLLPKLNYREEFLCHGEQRQAAGEAGGSDAESQDPSDLIYFETEDQLISNLEKYEALKSTMRELEVREDSRLLINYRRSGGARFHTRPDLSSFDLEALYGIFEEIASEFDEREIKQILVKEVSIEWKIAEVLSVISRGSESLKVRFQELMNDRRNLEEKVVTFLAILELAKQKRIKIYQDGVFADIEVRMCA